MYSAINKQYSNCRYNTYLLKVLQHFLKNSFAKIFEIIINGTN